MVFAWSKAVEKLFLVNFQTITKLFEVSLTLVELIMLFGPYTVLSQVLWGTKTPGQANDQRDEVILANKRKVSPKLAK